MSRVKSTTVRECISLTWPRGMHPQRFVLLDGRRRFGMSLGDLRLLVEEAVHRLAVGL